MKTTTNTKEPIGCNNPKSVCRGIALILAAVVVQGCATKKTAWLQQSVPPGVSAAMFEQSPPSEPTQPVVLLTFSF